MGLGIAIAVGGTPDEELSDAIWVEVHERMGETTIYRIHYEIDVRDGDFPTLIDSRLDADAELAIIAPFDGRNNYLVKGPVTSQQIHFTHGAAGSYVEVMGGDTSVVMDREAKSAAWADGTDSDAVRSILGQYGYAPDVESTQAGHFEEKHTLIQRDSDLRFVRRLARRNGFLFWITCDESGNEMAHFKRPPLDGNPTGNIDINLGTNNIATLDLRWDVDRPTRVASSQLNLNDKSIIDGAVANSPLPPLGASALGDIVTEPRSIHLAAPVDDSGDLQARGEGSLIDSGWFVRATGQTSVQALNAILRANSIVNLRGVGTRHSGKYYVASVRHLIDPSAHTMEFELIRNGWGN